MADIRNGNLGVEKMKDEIYAYLFLLKERYPNKRIMRQLVDGDKFLEMISKPPYCHCKTVSQLKIKISEHRNSLKALLERTDKYTENYQMTIFDSFEQISQTRCNQVLQERKRLTEEIKWLHKCLGMCSNRDYFK